MHHTRNTLSVLGVTNTKYFPYLLILAASVLKNMPRANFRAHLVNVSDDRAATLAALSPKIEITRENLDESDQKLLAAYAENRRAALIEEMLARGDQYVFYLDADAIVRKSLDGLIDLLEKADGLLLRQATVHQVSGTDRDRFAGGALAFRNTGPARAFVSRWAPFVASHIDDRFANQECLAPAYDELAGVVSIKPLPFCFIDWKLSLGSPVWIGKGPVTESRMYKLEVLRYTERLGVVQDVCVTVEQCFLRLGRALWELKNFLFFLVGTLRRIIFPRQNERGHQE